MYDVAIVGGGVTGAFCARFLMRYKVSVVILEASDDVAAGASAANSGIVHAGFDAASGTLKAAFNLRGNRMMQRVCAELGVKYLENGSIVAACGADEERMLAELLARGEKNGVEGLRLLSEEEAHATEPALADGVTGALFAPSGGIVCPYGLTIAAVGNAMDNGAELLCGFTLTAAERSGEDWRLFSEDGRSVSARVVVNCAGAGAERVARVFGDDSFRIGARKGEYILLDRTAGSLVTHTVFPVPSAAGKGVLVSPTVDGNLIVGPTSVEEETPDVSLRREAFAEIAEKAAHIVEGIAFGEMITSFAGVRSYCDRHDFIVGWSRVAGVYLAAGIESPGLTSAPAIGVYIADMVAEKLAAERNEAYSPIRRKPPVFREMTDAERAEMIARDPAYGRIVCRCEQVTLGEILSALRTQPPAHTLDGVKLRTRAGMGRCQGGFCQPAVFNLLMREYGYRAEEVTKKGARSYVITGGEL